MKIALLSCFYPYRGGISQFNSFLYEEFAKNHEVRAFNFKRQYPQFLFPGKTQYVEDFDKAVSDWNTPILDTANPFSYISTAKKIAKFNPDLLITRYWMSYFAPSLGTVNNQVERILRKRAKKNSTASPFKTLSITDNAIAHEPHFFDKPFSKYYFNSLSGAVAMSNVVKDDINLLNPNLKVRIIKHPIYSNYGERVDRLEARKELLNSTLEDKKVLLFFGLIRDYKGLDLLLEAMAHLGQEYHLIVAGEPYGSFSKYEKIIGSIENEKVRKNIHLFTHFIPDEKVKLLFSASDLCILPYRSATQSGISSVAWNFETPLVATPVGGLVEDITETKTGLLTQDVSSEGIALAIKKYFDNKLETQLKANIRKLKSELNWANFCSKLINFVEEL